MPMINLKFLDPHHFQESINLSLADSELPIGISGFRNITPKKNPRSKKDDQEIETRGKYILYQPEVSRSSRSYFVDDPMDPSPRTLGKIVVENGYTDLNSSTPGYYESLTLRTFHPLKLKTGVLPRCEIRLALESEELADTFLARGDKTRWAPFIWTRKDLSTLLPIEWFLKQTPPQTVRQYRKIENEQIFIIA